MSGVRLARLPRSNRQVTEYLYPEVCLFCFRTRLKLQFSVSSLKAEQMVKDTCLYKYAGFSY